MQFWLLNIKILFMKCIVEVAHISLFIENAMSNKSTSLYFQLGRKCILFIFSLQVIITIPNSFEHNPSLEGMIDLKAN